ncbi:urokinase plasminogen activator surface receptor-like [Kryptolebias marmoratus]|uniref:Urokinase plasminogen activator surface receptor-like n=1 Tax=Kryptolebias marmoratus TaxID=37003 RepID=A0A3Q3B0R9_KRYMA|nr:urokinase plasminogen activator surface receptor-like [Kryptolebias marmoratus]
MFIFTLVLGIWLLPKADTLTCYECQPKEHSGTCTDIQKPCPSPEHQCVATRTIEFKDRKKTDDQAKYCGGCVEYSVNFGRHKIVHRSKCCTEELCNKDSLPDYKSNPNGKKCYSCVGQNCTRTLNCEGDEDHCVKAAMIFSNNRETVKGCASKQVCWDKVANFLNILNIQEINCCQGDYCNSASSTRAGLLLLLVPLVSVVLFY